MSDTVPASCLQAPRAMIAAVLLVVASALGGCAGGGATGSGSYAMAPSAGGGATVAFESIDGPPPQVFDRMVSVLDSESKLRNLAIVSREGGASYRVRSYLSAQVVRGKTMIGFPAKKRPARPDAMPGRRPTTSYCGRLRRPASAVCPV